MISYETLKVEAKERGCKVTELIALAPQNDPFYTGAPAERDKAEWFADMWERFGFRGGVHLRRVHYRIISEPTVPTMPNGKPYENTVKCWEFLNIASKYARYLDLVDPSLIIDRRNPETVINARFSNDGDPWYSDPTPGYYVASDPSGGWDGYDLPGLPELPELRRYLPELADFETMGYRHVQQDYLIELWAEKTTMNDILLPLCQRYRANLVTGMGELTISKVDEFIQRVKQADRPARILYISDFDPAGLGMPVSIGRKIEYYQRHWGTDLDVGLTPAVLTGDQAQRYNLPRAPIKDSDRRKAIFERDHGKGATELDALEALHPGELYHVLESMILDYYDPELTSKAEARRGELVDDLDAQRDQVLEDHQSDLDDVKTDYQELITDFETTRADFTKLVEPFAAKIDAYQERMDRIKERGETVYGKVFEALKGVDLDPESDHPLPEPDLPVSVNGLLYDSDRDYWQQLEHYQAHRSGNGYDLT